MTWKPYIVRFQQTDYIEVRVKARNENEAIEKAKVSDGEWVGGSDAEVDTVYEDIEYRIAK